jgi:hypothetical protein
MPTIPMDVIWLVVSVAIGALAVAALMFVGTLRKTAGESDRWHWVGVFVNAAEQMYAGQEGKAKLDWVLAQLKKRYPSLDTDTIRAMVEAHVKTLR